MDSPPPAPGPIVRILLILLVESSTHRLTRRLWNYLSKKQTGLPHAFNFCLKSRDGEDLSEAQAMRFVANHTSIPVPKVYYAFTYKGSSHIIMSHIKGRMATQRWALRSPESKAQILSQLRQMVNELRSIPPPPGAGVSNVIGGSFRDGRLPNKSYLGPFPTVRDFHQSLVNGIDIDTEIRLAKESDYPGLLELFEFYRRADNKVVLTHGDLSSLNIIVHGDEVVGIIDWETSGWFPKYWEYTCAKYVNPQNPFWVDPVDQFLEPFPEELRMETIRRKYFGDF